MARAPSRLAPQDPPSHNLLKTMSNSSQNPKARTKLGRLKASQPRPWTQWPNPICKDRSTTSTSCICSSTESSTFKQSSCSNSPSWSSKSAWGLKTDSRFRPTVPRTMLVPRLLNDKSKKVNKTKRRMLARTLSRTWLESSKKGSQNLFPQIPSRMLLRSTLVRVSNQMPLLRFCWISKMCPNKVVLPRTRSLSKDIRTVIPGMRSVAFQQVPSN